MKAMFPKELGNSLVLPVRAAFRPLDQDSTATGNGMLSDFLKRLPTLSEESPMTSDHLDSVRTLKAVDVLPGATSRARGGVPESTTLANKKALSELDAVARREVFILSYSND